MDARNSIILQPDAAEYPGILRRCEVNGRPPVVTVQGNPALLDGKLLGFFCSIRCPGDIILKIYDLAGALRSKEVTLIGGFQSMMEKEFLDLVLRGSARVIICPARGLGTLRIPAKWRKPSSDGRLLLLSFFDDNMRRPVTAACDRRNAHVAALADYLLIGHAEKRAKPRSCAKTRWLKVNLYSPCPLQTTCISWNLAQSLLQQTTQQPFLQPSYAQHHYKVSKADASQALLRTSSSGLVAPLNGRVVIDTLAAKGEPGLFDRLIAGDYTRAGLEVLALDRKMVALPHVQYP